MNKYVFGGRRNGEPRKMVHVIKAEHALGKVLPDGAEVHHFDEDKSHNENSNLVICQDRSYHKLLHRRMKILRAGGNPDTESNKTPKKRINH